MDLYLSNGIAKPNPVICSKEKFSLAGLYYHGSSIRAVEELWKKFWLFVESERLECSQYFGICIHDLDMRNNEVFDYYIGFEIDKHENISKKLKILTVQKNFYAKFTHTGYPNTVDYTYDKIYKIWLPLTEYIPTMNMDIITVDNSFDKEKNKTIDIFIPVKV